MPCICIDVKDDFATLIKDESKKADLNPPCASHNLMEGFDNKHQSQLIYL